MKSIFRKCVPLVVSVLGFGIGPVFASDSVDAPEQVSLNASKSSSDVKPFGYWLFNGDFVDAGFVGFSPEYVVSIGDVIDINLWGGYEAQMSLEVDAQGNVFVPMLGPISVLGVSNSNLADVFKVAAAKVFNESVGVYAKLSSAQPVKVFVTGYVSKPGLYAGHSSDSALRFLDLAGGIKPSSGSYTNVHLKRAGNVIAEFNLYDFVSNGEIVNKQLRDGDVLVVGAAQPRVLISGHVDHELEFELTPGDKSLARVLKLAGVHSRATHVRLSTQNNGKTDSFYLPIDAIEPVTLAGGDEVEVITDVDKSTFSVRIEGEHNNAHEVVVSEGDTLASVMANITHSKWGDIDAVHLYRESVKQRQKEMLDNSLSALEASLLTARSNTADEANLRQMEADLITQWVDRARDVELKGQVILSDKEQFISILLEPDDVIVIPKKTSIVMVHGDVVSPVASSFRSTRTVQEYIEMAGGFNQKASTSKVLVVSRGGQFKSFPGEDADEHYLEKGDEVMVIPSVATKSIQVSKDLSQVIYQIAVSAGTVLSLVL